METASCLEMLPYHAYEICIVGVLSTYDLGFVHQEILEPRAQSICVTIVRANPLSEFRRLANEALFDIDLPGQAIRIPLTSQSAEVKRQATDHGICSGGSTLRPSKLMPVKNGTKLSLIVCMISSIVLSRHHTQHRQTADQRTCVKR